MYISSSYLLAVVGMVSYAAAPIAAQYLDNEDYTLAIREAFPEFDVDFEDLLSLEARMENENDASKSATSPGASGAPGPSGPSALSALSGSHWGTLRQFVAGAGSANFPGMRTGRAALAVGALGALGKAASMPIPQQPDLRYDAKRQRELFRSAVRAAKPPAEPRTRPTFSSRPAFGGSGKGMGKRSLDDMLDEELLLWV